MICANRNRTGRRLGRRWRRGAAIVEMAVVAPLLLTMLFGVIEFGWSFMVHETITNTARECCRLATLQGTTDEDIQTRFTQSMAGTGVTVTPAMMSVNREGLGDSQVVTVNIAVPYSQVSITGLLSFLHIQRETLSSSCSMRVEGAF